MATFVPFTTSPFTSVRPSATPTGGARFTPFTATPRGRASRTATSPAMSFAPSSRPAPPPPNPLRIAAGIGSNISTITNAFDAGPAGNTIAGLSSLASLIARLQDPTSSAAAKGLGVTKDVTSLANIALRTDAGRALLKSAAPIQAGNIAGALSLANIPLGFGLSALDFAEGRTASGMAGIQAGVPAAAVAAGGAAGVLPGAAAAAAEATGGYAGAATGFAPAASAAGTLAVPLALGAMTVGALSQQEPARRFQSAADAFRSMLNPISFGIRSVGSIFGQDKTSATLHRKEREAAMFTQQTNNTLDNAARILSGKADIIAGQASVLGGQIGPFLGGPDAVAFRNAAMEKEYTTLLDAGQFAQERYNSTGGQAAEVRALAGMLASADTLRMGGEQGRSEEVFYPYLAAHLSELNTPADFAAMYSRIVNNPNILGSTPGDYDPSRGAFVLEDTPGSATQRVTFRPGGVFTPGGVPGPELSAMDIERNSIPLF